MERVLGRMSPAAYVALRIVAGVLFAAHGVQKLFGLPSGQVVSLASRSGVAGVIEIVTGTMMALGVLTSWAAFIASGEMAFAYFLVHASRGVSPIANRGEPAALYCFLFLYIATRGTVAFGLDARRGRRV